MIFGLMVIATLAALFSGILCKVINLKNSYVVLLVQFLFTFGVSYGTAYWMGKGVFTNGYIALVCAVISVVIYGVLFLAQKLLGPLDSRKPGTWAIKLNHHHHNAGRHHTQTR
ncbi:MAG: hypothetical protein H7249_05355 [Chitinophagaceae bacterium]|nr:hypothetical protein [Oligoflexus sp.]